MVMADFYYVQAIICIYMSKRLILGLRPANERRRCFVATSRIGWAQA